MFVGGASPVTGLMGRGRRAPGSFETYANVAWSVAHTAGTVASSGSSWAAILEKYQVAAPTWAVDPLRNSNLFQLLWKDRNPYSASVASPTCRTGRQVYQRPLRNYGISLPDRGVHFSLPFSQDSAIGARPLQTLSGALKNCGLVHRHLNTQFQHSDSFLPVSKPPVQCFVFGRHGLGHSCRWP